MFWSWFWRTLLAWVFTPVLGWLLSVQHLPDTAVGVLLVLWILAVPFFSYRRARIVRRQAEARDDERMTAAVAEGVRRATISRLEE
jgi:hypothetical protein